MERGLLAAQLAEQKELLKKAQDEAEKKEAALLAEFESGAPPGLTGRRC